VKWVCLCLCLFFDAFAGGVAMGMSQFRVTGGMRVEKATRLCVVRD